MAILNFPDTAGQPTDGSFQYTENNITYSWNGSYWSSATGASSDLDNRYLNSTGPETLTGDLTITGDLDLGVAQGLDTVDVTAGTLYIITGNSDPVAPGQFTALGAPDGDIDTTFLATGTGTLSGGNTVATAATGGLVEAKGGVRVTGNNNAAFIQHGIYAKNSSLNRVAIAAGSVESMMITPAQVGIGDTVFPRPGAILTVGGPVNQPSSYALRFTPTFGGGVTTGAEVVRGFHQFEDTGTARSVTNAVVFNTFAPSKPSNVSIDSYTYYSVGGGSDVGTNSTYGYSSRLSAGSANKTFAFFSSGDAPNFFKGDTYIGGSTSRNTRELWESTLNEEQKEQLAAGTLAIPANVSVPGDGSFVRQWWYDQQSTEDQALIDIGELEYPAPYAAATFTDTFALGDSTRIEFQSSGNAFFGNTGSNDDTRSGVIISANGSVIASRPNATDICFITRTAGSATNTSEIHANGLGEFGGGVKVTGGSDTAVSNGLGSTFTGILNFYANGSEFMRGAGDRIVIGTEDTAEKGNIAVAMPLKIKTASGFNGLGSGVSINSYVDADVTDVTLFNTFGKTNHNVDEFIHFSANKDGTDDVQGDLQVGFKAASSLSTADLNYGFAGYLAADGNTNYNFYAAGSAPNYFGGVIRTGTVTAPVGTGGDGNPQSDDSNRFWATESTDSNAFRIGSGFQSSYFNTNATGVGNFINRIGSSSGRLISFYEAGVFVDAIQLDPAGGITWGTSDYRLKENIVDLPSATDAVKSLRPVNFNFKSHPGKTRPGFIAHELQETLPVAVTGEKDATEAIGTLADYDGTVLETEVTEPTELEYTEDVTDEYGVSTQTIRTRTWTSTGTRPVYQGVDQTKLIPLLTKALQEALERIEALEAAQA